MVFKFLGAAALCATAFAAEPFYYPLWEPSLEYPSADRMPFLSVVTHVTIERATPAGYHYLHEPGIAMHKGVLWTVWANGPREMNYTDELVRASQSRDRGMTWSAPQVVAPGGEGMAHTHPGVFSHNGTLYFFVTRFDQTAPKVPQLEIFVLNEETGKIESRGIAMRNFVVFDTPKRLPGGGWIFAGESHFEGNPRVLLSRGDDLLKWEAVDIPLRPDMKLIFPETSLMVDRDEIVAVTRNSITNVALVSVSKDQGRTWSVAKLSNYPMSASKPVAGMLSTGQRYLISNAGDDERRLLSVAVSRPGERLLSRVWKIRHQGFPMRRSPTGVLNRAAGAQWAYPAAIELDGALYVVYSVSKEDLELSVIPLRALRVD